MAYDSEHGKLWQDIKADLDKTRARASKFADDAQWAFGRRTGRVLGVVMLFAVVVALLFVFLDWYIAPTKASEKKGLVLALAQILGVTALLSGLYLTWRTLQVNREGQITERFTRAIDQLGSNELEIRLGSIYALERIARDSEQDHWPIMEVLIAYVGQHVPWRPEEEQEGTDDAAGKKKSTEGASGLPEPAEVPTLDPDIQAIITVLQRRTRYLGHGEPGVLDLHETNLSRANLMKMNLQGANLGRANLTEANLLYFEDREHMYITNLGGANLRGADLEGADLRVVQLEGADLEGAALSGPYLGGPTWNEPT